MTTGWLTLSVLSTEFFEEDESTACLSMPSYPFPVAEATGGFVNSRVVICGGYHDWASTPVTSQCYSLGPNETEWMPNGNLITPRFAAASVVMNDKLLIFGGYNTGYLQTTEEMDIAGRATLGPSMPFAIKHHCAVKVNPTTALIIGGADESSSIKSTHFYDFYGKTFKSGPDLKVARERHACGILSTSDRSFVVVTGGKNDEVVLGTTEYMTLDDLTAWSTGLQILTIGKHDVHN